MIYDRFQKEAIGYINEGHCVIISAPTGAGKTAVAEHIIQDCLNKETGVIYTAPVKALSNQKFRDFQKQYKDNIGILTGDVSINAYAPVLIMTTEILRNKILDEPESLRKYSWVIFDEIHYIDNTERGTVWEESLIFLPEHLKILCLSATIPNIQEFSDWIEFVHKMELKVVVEDKRPVPLHFFFQAQNEIVDNLKDLKRLDTGHKLDYQYRGKKRQFITHAKPNKLSTLITYIRQNQGLPCIYFVFGRRRAEKLSGELYGYNFLERREQEEIITLFEELCARFDLKNEESALRMLPLIKRGIAYHHAGMLPTLKEVIERLFTSKLLKVIFTTETFALGINMPARTVIFDELRKFYGRYFRNLKTRDFYQMAGRAGRRGMDSQGKVYCRINPHRISTDEVKGIIYGESEEVRSQLNSSYATILNLFSKYKEKLYDIYPRSLHYFQSNKHKRSEALELIESKVKLLKDFGYITKDALTDKGKFASSVYGYELILAQLYAQGILEQLDEFDLGVLAVAVVFEPRKNQEMQNISKSSRRLKAVCADTFDTIKQKELKYKIRYLSKEPFFHLSSSIEAWLRGTEFSKILQFTDTDEGEVVRYFRMGSQILREIKDGRFASHILREKITETLRVINRGIIDAEKQLREG